MSVKIVIGYLKLLQRVLQHYHIDFASSSVSPDLLKKFHQALAMQSSEFIDIHEYILLLNEAQQYFSRPIALVLAEQATLADVGLVGYLASTSVDLQQALVFFEQYYSLLYQQTNEEDLVVEKKDQEMFLYWHAAYHEWQNFYELCLALIYIITKSIVEHELIPPNFIYLGYPPKFALYHYEKFFKTKVYLKTQTYGVSFPIENLQMRNLAADFVINQVLSDQAKHSLKQDYDQQDYVEQLRYKIKRMIEKGMEAQANLQPYVAQQFHYSERTLQRQLKQHQLNFQSLVDECRYEKAQMYLKQGKSFSEVAALLNYADQSAFGRAFKRWSGQTPKQFLQH